MNNLKITYTKKEYVDKKGELKTAYNYRVYYTDLLYVNITPTFKDDYFTLNSLRKKGLIKQDEN